MRGNSQVRATVIQRMQQSVGNRQTRVAVQRAGWGTGGLVERPSGRTQEELLAAMTDDERESFDASSRSDQMWDQIYEEYPDMAPNEDSMDDDEYTAMRQKAQYDLDNPPW